ncbi:MAG: protein phosphatase CheZ [Desulfovibrio sp.]|nr:protein phosphatase CheZ [Desulfovibrio sp.]
MSTETQEPIYKKLSDDMRQGLKDIYQQISTASHEEGLSAEPDARALFREATSQLGEVLKSTEEAATNILEIVERNEANQEEAAALIEKLSATKDGSEELGRLSEINTRLSEDLTNLTLQLSFQDLTGQRIKRVVSALNRIEDTVVNLYVTSGLIMEGAENDPHKDVETLKADAEKAMEDFKQGRQKMASELKGPDTNGISQKVIDDMLAQLGM